MCGRFTLHYGWQQTTKFIIETFGVELDESLLPLPNYNVAPTQQVIVLIHDGEKYRIGLMKWGFTLGQGINKPVVNARSETIIEKPFFRQAVRTKRCLILATGFYEWDRKHHPSIPYWFYPASGDFMVFAGIYQSIIDQDGNKNPQVSFITTASNDVMKPIHDRLPVILNPDQYLHWVHPKTPIDELLFIFKPTNYGSLSFYEVSSRVNVVKNNDALNLQAIKKVAE
jgi:putative SOS response-associated peptidase YedK